MDTARDSDRLQHLYLTGVRPNGKEIGVGAYGRVFEVEFCEKLYAAKEIHLALTVGVEREGFERMKRMFIAECLQSSALGHENVVQVLGVYNPGSNPGDESRLPVLVMERMQESLTSLVEKYPNIPMCVKLSILLDVSRGLWYLHSHNLPIVHRDLSPNNILLTNQFVAKINDLGVAKVIRADSKKTKTPVPGTVHFMGPEALAEIPEYGPPLDVFSYGGVILHVVNQEWPKPLHYVVTDPKTKKLVALSEVERRQEHVEKMRGAPEDLKHLVEQCLDNDPSRRPPISDVSKRMRRMKEAENVRCPDVTMNPITWQVEQLTKMLRDTAISPSANKQTDIFNETVKVKWKEVAPLPVGRSAHTAVLLHGSVYVGGGVEDKDAQPCYRLDIYNVYANQWSTSPITTPYCWFAMTVLDDKLIIAGGQTKTGEVTNKVLVLDEGEWKDYSEMPTARDCATAVAYQSMLIMVGGKTMVETTLATTELLDTTNGSWCTCDPLPVPHFQIKCIIIKNILCFRG
ncbi:putative mitogen-activated protein kinase kinase kinase 7-like isoform X2 [Dysidea avara]|uniref:putative mitogen-activated protein kinase kinase kinase 7-like isoform X2 n=1 Tax=Dysidea avara TaxID=196820 RepID=UPI00332CE541